MCIRRECVCVLCCDVYEFFFRRANFFSVISSREKWNEEISFSAMISWVLWLLSLAVLHLVRENLVLCINRFWPLEQTSFKQFIHLQQGVPAAAEAANSTTKRNKVICKKEQKDKKERSLYPQKKNQNESVRCFVGNGFSRCETTRIFIQSTVIWRI